MKHIPPLFFLLSLILTLVLEIVVLVYQEPPVSSADMGSIWNILFYQLAVISVLFFMYLPKTASRVCAISARFALDALPGKQMQIENAFHNKLMSHDQMIEEKEKLQYKVDYLGSLDGISDISGSIIRIALPLPFLACLRIFPFQSLHAGMNIAPIESLVPRGIIISGFVFLLLYTFILTLMVNSSRSYKP